MRPSELLWKHVETDEAFEPSEPTFATPGSAGIDLAATRPAVVFGGSTRLVSTGIAVKIPPGTVGLICPRSGLAAWYGVTVLNAPGVIDEDYRGEIMVLLYNASGSSHWIERGDRVAQLLIVPIVRPIISAVVELDDTIRGAGGFGSTGA
jgi:dUTP pyrophosphatase